MPIWYAPLILWGSLGIEVWPERLNVCSDSTAGNDHSSYLFLYFLIKIFFCSRPFSAVLVLEAVHSNSVFCACCRNTSPNFESETKIKVSQCEVVAFSCCMSAECFLSFFGKGWKSVSHNYIILSLRVVRLFLTTKITLREWSTLLFLSFWHVL